MFADSGDLCDLKSTINLKVTLIMERGQACVHQDRRTRKEIGRTESGGDCAAFGFSGSRLDSRVCSCVPSEFACNETSSKSASKEG